MRWLQEPRRHWLRGVVCGAVLAFGGGAARADTTAEDAALQALAERTLNLVRQRVGDCSGAPAIASLAPGVAATASDAPAIDRPPLRFSPQLAQAAARHAGAMARSRVFAHVGADGTTVRERVDATGYRWQVVAENLAAGQGDFAEAISDWLASASHCAALVDSRYTEFGVARSAAMHPHDTYGMYWTLVLGRPR